MRPLTPLKYFATNKSRAATIFIVLVLAVAVISFITSLVTSIVKDAKMTNLAWLDSMSFVDHLSDDVFLSEDVIAKVNSIAEVDRAYGASGQSLMLDVLIGNTTSPVLIPCNPEDIPEIMERIGLVVVEGRLPGGDDTEIILHDRLLKNKGLQVGDYTGSDVEDHEMLRGKYKIVGSLAGDAIISFANKNCAQEPYKEAGMVFERPSTLLLFPKAGAMAEMNDKLAEFSEKEAIVVSHAIVEQSFNEELRSMNILLFIIIFVVVFIVAISVSALMYIVYLNRSEEFGILYAMGYKERFINKLIIKELAVLSVVCWAGGYVLSWLLLGLVTKIFLAPKGQALYFFTTMGLVNTFTIPLLVLICTTFPILRRLKKWDAIAVIERRG